MAGEKSGIFEKIKGVIKEKRDQVRKPKGIELDAPLPSDEEIFDDDRESEAGQDNKTRTKHSESDPLPKAESAKESAEKKVQTLPRSWQSRMERISGSENAEGMVVKTSAEKSTEKPIDQQIEEKLNSPVAGSHRAKASEPVANKEITPARTENSRGQTAPVPPPKPAR